MIINEINESNFEEEREKGREQVQLKFYEWDKLQKLSIPIEEYKAKAAYMMRDPTIWAYSNLKDKEQKQLECYGFQDTIMNDRHRFIHVTAANQIGKTWSASIIKGAHHALHTNNASVMLISRSENQAKGMLDEIKWMLRRSKIDYEPFIDEVANRFEYHLESPNKIGTSVIRVFPPTESILSFPATLIIMDETGFWEEKNIGTDAISYFQESVEPRTNTTKNWTHPFLTMGQIVSITNPNGQDGLAWWFYNSKKFHNYMYNWLAKPDNTLEEYLEKEDELPPIQFARVYAATYLLAKGGFIDLVQYERFKNYNVNLAIPPTTIYLGGDFASEDPKSKNTDWFTLYGVVLVPNKLYPQNPRVRLVYWREWPPRTKREEIYDEIERIKKLPGVYIGKFGYDKVGVGDSVKSDLTKRGILSLGQIEALTYSLPNKSDVFLNLQGLFHQDLVEGTEIHKLKKQLLALKVEKPTGSPHIKVHHKTEGTKDDHPDAFANACYVAKQSAVYVRSAFVSSQVKSQDSGIIEKSIEVGRQFEEYLRENQAGFC